THPSWLRPSVTDRAATCRRRRPPVAIFVSPGTCAQSRRGWVAAPEHRLGAKSWSPVQQSSSSPLHDRRVGSSHAAHAGSGSGDEGGWTVSDQWPSLNYRDWSPTCDTLHAHVQVLGKLAVALAPPEPQLQHAALRLTARGWETLPLPAPDRSGAIVVVLDLRWHEAVAEHSDGRSIRVPLTPDRPVGEVTRDVLAGVRHLGGPVEI